MAAPAMPICLFVPKLAPLAPDHNTHIQSLSTFEDNSGKLTAIARVVEVVLTLVTNALDWLGPITTRQGVLIY